jgi:hypothetical protein
LTDYTPNAWRLWEDIAGTEADLTLQVMEVTGTITHPEVAFVPIEGEVSVPLGFLDSGGGNEDALVMCIDPSEF